MKREELEKLGITEKETIDAILNINSSDIGKAKGDVEAKETELTELKGQLADRDKDIAELSKQTGNSAELQTQLQELQDKYKMETEALTAKVTETKRDSAIELGLIKAGARNVKAAKALLDLEKLELGEDGNLKGLEDQVKALNESDSYLFGTGETTGQFAAGGNPTGSTNQSDVDPMPNVKMNEFRITR